MKLDYYLYMAESEGLDGYISTREAKIQAIINDFIRLARQRTDINEARVQEHVCRKHGVDRLTAKEKNYIARQVERRL